MLIRQSGQSSIFLHECLSVKQLKTTMFSISDFQDTISSKNTVMAIGFQRHLLNRTDRQQKSRVVKIQGQCACLF